MASLQTIGVRTVRQTLIANSTISTLVGTKIFWEGAPEDVEFPYVIIQHITGGEDNDAKSRACDMLWKVVGITADKATAGDLADEIHNGLFRRDHVTTGIPEALGYTWIEETLPIFDRIVKQNTAMYQAGGIYRIRLSLEDIT